MNLLRSHLTGLIDFKGREKRQPFWLWVLVTMALLMLLTMLTFIPFFIGTFGKIEQFARDHPDQVTRTVGAGSYSVQVQGHHPELMPDFGAMIGLYILVAILIVALLAAAVARRLRDTGRSGWWGTMPLPFLITGMGVMYRLSTLMPEIANASDGQPPAAFVGLFGLMMINNFVYIGALITLIVFCCMPTQPGDNRYDRGLE